MTAETPQEFAVAFAERQEGKLPGVLGMEWETVRKGLVRGRFTVGERHMAPNGFLHAASVITLADSACGYGSFVSLPEGASGFTTIELKTNFLGTAREGVVSCEAKLVHGGRTTQLWDAEVRHEDTGKLIALFRCTQAVLWPKG
jgi:1,4-dihydroxy-2-naphthoyl-CoA hydrolase